MRENRIVPTGVERTFGADEIIVSKTDPQGRLTYVNPLFIDISGYPESELIGQPHNIIRHPDMPRSLFQQLWTRIAAGDELFAYIVNLSANGDHYWVLAHVTPTLNPAGNIVGYHSNRRTASALAISRVQEIYRQLLTEERAHTQTPAALAAGSARLTAILEGAGMSYDEFVWSIAREEEAAA